MQVLTRLFPLFLFLWIGGYVVCTAAPEKTDPPQPINIVVILDNSDRISSGENPGQVEKDRQIVKDIVSTFENEFVIPEFYIDYQHQLVFAVPEQSGMDPIPLTILKDEGGGEPKFSKTKKKLLQEIDSLYNSIIKANEEVFTGSDIWNWFRKSAKAYLQQDAVNYIICISDGYLDFNNGIEENRPKRGNKTTFMQVELFRDNPDWVQKFDSEGHGLLITEDFPDFKDYTVNFLMVEIKLRPEFMLDFPILEKYWRSWLNSMGITDAKFLESQDDTSIVKGKIKEFLSK